VYYFEHDPSRDLAPYPDRFVDDRQGPPRIQGLLLLLVTTLAAEHILPDTLSTLSHVDPAAWYHGQVLEDILTVFESHEPQLPKDIGKNVFYMVRSQLRGRARRTPADVIEALPLLWQQITRGASGVWHAEMVSPRHAVMKTAQPYNCRFIEGIIHGALESVDALDVQITHRWCVRQGSPWCAFDVVWHEELDLVGKKAVARGAYGDRSMAYRGWLVDYPRLYTPGYHALQPICQNN
jgi:hypothetical protein